MELQIDVFGVYLQEEGSRVVGAVSDRVCLGSYWKREVASIIHHMTRGPKSMFKMDCPKYAFRHFLYAYVRNTEKYLLSDYMQNDHSVFDLLINLKT